MTCLPIPVDPTATVNRVAPLSTWPSPVGSRQQNVKEINGASEGPPSPGPSRPRDAPGSGDTFDPSGIHVDDDKEGVKIWRSKGRVDGALSHRIRRRHITGRGGGPNHLETKPSL